MRSNKIFFTPLLAALISAGALTLGGTAIAGSDSGSDESMSGESSMTTDEASSESGMAEKSHSSDHNGMSKSELGTSNGKAGQSEDDAMSESDAMSENGAKSQDDLTGDIIKLFSLTSELPLALETVTPRIDRRLPGRLGRERAHLKREDRLPDLVEENLLR